MALVVQFLLLLLSSLSIADVSPITNPGLVCVKNNTRQVRSAAERELQLMIQMINHKMLPEIRAIYSVAKRSNQTTKKKSCVKLNKLISSISAEQNVVLAHQKFYNSLFEMSFVLDDLQHLRINAEFTEREHFQELRQKIFTTTKTRLGLVICEFYEILTFNFNTTMSAFSPVTKRTRCIPKDPDLSQIGTLDIQFFSKLRRLFKVGKTTLKKLKRKSSLLTKRRKHTKTTRHSN